METQADSAIEHYFNNNGNGYQNTDKLELKHYPLNIEIYSNSLKKNKLEEIRSELERTVEVFHENFDLTTGAERTRETFKIHIFNNKEDYLHYGNHFKLGLGDEGGKTYYRGTKKVHSDIYVYQQGEVLNLKHEVAHALTFYKIGRDRKLPKFLIEGLAELLERSNNPLEIQQDAYLNLNFYELKTLDYGDDRLYKIGHAIIRYLQESNPNYLRNYLARLKRSDLKATEELLTKLTTEEQKIKEWIYNNSLQKAITKNNALSISATDHPFIRNGIVNGEKKEIAYVAAEIKRPSGETVSQLPHKEYYCIGNCVRASDSLSNDYFDIGKEYQFLKVIEESHGGIRLTYCNAKGELYEKSTTFKNDIAHTLINDTPALNKIYQLIEKRRIAKKNALEQALKSPYGTEIYTLYHQAEQADKLETNFLHSLVDFFQEGKKTNIEFSFNGETINIDVKLNAINEKTKKEIQAKIEHLQQLLIVDPQQVKSTVPFAPGKIIPIGQDKQGTHGDISAVNLFDGDRKIGELLSGAGYFHYPVDNPKKQQFIYTDTLKNLNITYNNAPSLALTKKSRDDYQLSFIENFSSKGDEYAPAPHWEVNELLDVPSQYLPQEQRDALLFSGTVIKHKDQSAAHYSDEQKRNGLIVEKGSLLNDKGTDNPADDVYAAHLTQKEKMLMQFKNTAFYITEEVEGKSSLFIHDHGTGKRWQLPNEVTHLKLMQDEKGKSWLLPCNKDGKIPEEGMPDIPKEYLYIDPIFAHRYSKQDHSHRHTNIGLINFSDYESGTLFKIKFDPNDTMIPRDATGKILRDDSRRIYFTKVKLYDPYNREIGMLSNSFHHYQGGIFLAADLNYSYSDFFASISPLVEIKKEGNMQYLTFNRGKGDIGNTDRGFTDHHRVVIPQINQLSHTMAGGDNRGLAGNRNSHIRRKNGIHSPEWSSTAFSRLEWRHS